MERPARFLVDPTDLEPLLDPLFGESLHAKRIRSLSDGALGVLHAAELGISAIGRGLAAARGLATKHSIKQIDRLLSNQALDPWKLANIWAKHCLQTQTEWMVNLDWTDFEADDHVMLVAAAQTGHGRAQALLWKTYKKSSLKDRQVNYEREFLEKLRSIIPPEVKTTVVADRGFGSTTMYQLLAELQFDYIIRFKQNIHISHGDHPAKPASEWAYDNGRMRTLRKARITQAGFPVGSVFLVKERGMKEPWCIVASQEALESSKAKEAYGKRFTIEELFRDIKNGRMGLGLSEVRMGKEARRDVMMWLVVLAVWLLTELGQAGEDVGLDGQLKSNTSPHRQHSLLRQGLMWMELLPTRKPDVLQKLAHRFGERLQRSPIFSLLAMEK